VHPVALLYASLLTGAMPLTFGQEGMVLTAFGRLDLSAIRLFGLCLVGLFITLAHGDRVLHYLPDCKFHVLFLLFSALALLWSPSLIYGVRMLAKLTAPFLFLLLCLVLVSSVAQLRVMERVTLAGGVLAVVGAIVTTSMGLSPPGLGLTLPAMSPALFSAYLVAVGMLALASSRYEGRARNLLAFVIVSGAILAAFTRITIAALFISSSLILWLALRGGARFLLPLAGLLGLPALFLVSEFYKSRMFFGADKITLSTIINDPGVAWGHLHGSGRFAAWEYVLDHFVAPSPILGSGIGATQHFYYTQSVGGMGVIHSEYVRLAAEVGIVGLVLFCLAAAGYLVCLLRTYRFSPDSLAGRYSLAAMGGLISYLIFMATDNAFDYVNAFGIYVFGLIGMSVKARELEAARAEAAAAFRGSDSHASPPLVMTSRAARKKHPRYALVGE
jgi:hypothetical protein